ncbi:MAG TPA: alginate lyase family protein [Candidatus Dormibacteraeota bacterium]|nr:alginate lyase family protein [Candidatus Dormibacteraeota bacterium]
MENRASRLHRVSRLNQDEVATRLRQFASARIDWLKFRAGHDFVKSNHDFDIRPLGEFFFSSTDAPLLCDLLQRVLPAQAADIVLRASKLCEHHFDLLGYSDLDYGANIDWHLDVVHGKRAPRQPWFKVEYLNFDQVGDSKITWELNRHQYFPTLAKAYWLTENDKFVQEIFAQWEQWQRENPYPVGINWASSLEVGFRCIAWTWTFFLLQECPIFTTEIRRRWLAMLNLSGRHVEMYLSTYFSPNTHLIGEGLALFYLGTLFRLPSSERWRDIGWNILLREAAKQVREDGFYFEQSTYYHVYALDMFLHARILATKNRIAIPDEFDRKPQRMLDALLMLCRAGVPPMFGDDDGGRLFDPRRFRTEHMLDPLATGAVLYRRGDFKFLAGASREEMIWLLGAEGLARFESLPLGRPSTDSIALANSGFYLMTDAESEQQLVIDAGPLGAGSGGHGHADALSVWLVRKGRSLLRDSGTFEYVGESGERSRLRSTGAHSTLQVDGQGQANTSGPFSWQSFPEVKVRRRITGQQFDLLEAEHDGFSHSSSPVTHRRLVFHRKGAFWLVRDVVEGSGRHEIELAWQVGAGLSQESADADVFAGEGERLAILPAEDHGWSRRLVYENWSPVYGHAELAPVLRFAADQALPAEFVTILIASSQADGDQSQDDMGRLVCVSKAGVGTASVFRYVRHQEDHQFVFAREAEPWSQGPWASDADFLYSHHGSAGRLCSLVLCGGTYADFEGSRVVCCDRSVSYAEVMRTSDGFSLFSSEVQGVRLGAALDGQFGAIKIYRHTKI